MDLSGGRARYVVHRRLGRGGMGVVHLATMTTPVGERRVAIKQLCAAKDGRPIVDRAASERIVAEARLVFMLTHANVCQVLDLALGDDGAYIVMELVDGCDLASLISNAREHGEPLPVAVCAHVAKEIAKGLDYAHRARGPDGRGLWLVHGDVTPRNILISREGEVKLADFGIARALGIAAPGDHLRAGTPGFMAPETAAGTLDQRADVYALGASLYHSLSGRAPPIAGAPDVRALIEQRPELGHELVEILERALAPRAESRYQVAGDLARDLSAFLALRFPRFDERSVGKLVRAGASAIELEDATTSELVSMTGTLLDRPALRREPARVEPVPAGTKKIERAVRRKRRGVLLIALAAILGLAAIAAVWANRDDDAPASKPAAALPNEAPTAAPPPVDPPHLAASRGETTATDAATTRLPSRSRPRAATPPRASPSPAVTGMGYLTVTSVPWGAVYVDGRQVAQSTPAYKVPIAGGKHRVSIASPERGERSPERIVTIAPGQSHSIGFEW